MSSVEEKFNDGNFASHEYNFAKIFHFDNDFQKGTLENDTGAEKTYPIGTVLGREAATENLKVLDDAAVDGTQFPVGVLAQEVTLADTATQEVTFCTKGGVDENLLVFEAGIDLTTVVSLKTVRDRLAADTAGIILTTATENTRSDNS